ncbi:Retrovirus-related Pol polyprotein from transposon RE1 (Retro element 1) (AtRE1) [Includes: Protease RE1 [Durusdinium trenchii]|uniref:Retrovirus-related Pol polyprotein from transposon RE1 (Retro element 1) (AtRE1) n=1 Tax=Durusdinium trenchii TaxID=1381693 RepID=A0ABP0JSR9_9DINO
MGSESAEGVPTEASSVPWKDKDPPPGFDGDVDKFKDYLRELKMWRHETDVPVRKHGVKILRALSGPAKAVCNEIEVDHILSEGGADALVTKLKEYYAPHPESAMPKAFERAVYGEARKMKETFGEFIVRQDALFRSLKEEGVTLDDTVRGYILFRQANLSQMQEDQVTTWTQGKYDRPSVVAALRKLEKVQRDRGGKHYVTTEDIHDEEMDSEEDKDFIYIGEDDLTQIYEESELNEALATYQQVRQAIREQRNGRGYFQPKGKGGGSPSSSKGNRQTQNIKFTGKGTRVHIDVLKLRTKCAKCGQIGHWAKECTNEPDGKGKGHAASDGSSPKSGFFEVVSMEGGSGSHVFHITLGQCLEHARAGRRSQEPPFSGITTQSTMGIVDTAAQGGLIGLPALERLQEALRVHHLKVKWTGKQAQAKGIGGSAKVCGVVEIPVGIAGVNGLIEATVVEEEAHRLNPEAMDFIARIRSLDKKDEWEKVSMTDPHVSEKAVRNWRVIMEHVADVMDLVRAQIRLEAWQQGGSGHGSPLQSSFSHLASGSEPFSCMEGASQSQITKASIYAELIQIGDFLGQRKCQVPPARSMKGCDHPPAALAGAGNQSQREVWCRKCHARWAVDRQVMDEIAAKKNTIHVNGKSFHLTGKSKAREKSPPRTPVRTPSAKKSTRSPGSPGIPDTPEGAEKMINRSGIKCHCKELAVQLIVKKEGPTQGRLFWKCARRLCSFFEWDPEETQFLQQRLMQEKEDEEAKKWQEQEELDRRVLIQNTMEVAESRHQEIMMEAQTKHAMEMETMKNQLLWMSAVAGEERLDQVFQSQELQQEMMVKAMKMKEELQAQEPEQMDRELQEDAPRVIKLKNELQWSLWTKKQLEDQQLNTYERQVADGYWLLEEESWQFHQGILPEYESTGHEVAVVEFAEDFFKEDLYEPGEDKQLARSSRKALKKKMRQLVVSEVFSPPRVCQEAEAQGHLAGGSFDLVTGYDLTVAKDQRRCWKALKEADPDILVVCPPCGPFSILQSLNQARGSHTLALKLKEGRACLRFAMEVFRWQTARKKLAIFEHPSTSKAWQEECVMKMMEIPGVQRVRADQCRYGLSVREKVLNKKPTDFMTNGEHTALALSRRCEGGHEHRHLIGGIAKFAQQYPRGLCRAMLDGGTKDVLQETILVWATTQDEGEQAQAEEDIEELLRRHEEQEGAQDQVRQRLTNPDEREEGPLDDDTEMDKSKVSREDQRLIKKLHTNLGHPSNQELCRALRIARARSAVWRYVKEDFKCEECEKNKKPRSARPAALPKTMEPCRTVGLDVVFFPALDVRKVRPVLNMVDWATGYQMLEPLDNTQSSHVWEKFYGTWVRTFSVPEVVVTDQGREFSKELAEKVSEAGALHRIIGARAPWQQGRTERHGGLAKEVFMKLRESALPTCEGEWKMCIYAVEAAKNRLFNRSGFSPAQRQFGYNMRLPGSLGSDDVYSPELLVQSSSDDMKRTLEIRSMAMQEFIKHTTSTAVAKARRARGRGTPDFKVGDIIYVYRVPLQRKRARTEVTFEDREGRKATWVGPGVIVMIEGANAWLSIRGELWKCAQEQLRHASPEEKEAKDMLRGEFEDLKIEMTRKASKKGYKDITQWEHPPPTMDDEEDEAPRPRQRPRLGTEMEPEAEESRSEITSIPESGIQARQENIEEDPEVVEQAVESNRRCEQLDGTLPRRRGEDLYGPTRRHLHERWRPYQGGYVPGSTEEVEEDDEERRDEDLWVYDEKKRCLIRMHNTERGVHFTPSNARGCPVSLKYLTSHRKTVKCLGDGSISVHKENWRNSPKLKETKETQGPLRWWTGYTEFPLRKTPPEAETALMVKRGSDEVKEEDIPEEEWEQWRISDGAEWSKVEATGAVKALDEEESQEVETQLKEAGLAARILPSRMVRRWKRSEQPGTPPTRKSRWCIRGDQDPDLLELNQHAPTVTTSTLSVVLQIAASKGWKAAVGDLRNAFMQSDKLVRKAGRLFCKQPKGGLPGLKKNQLIEILAGAYGLGDAPAHWRRSLKKVLFQCGFTQSILDPCVFKSFREGKLSGLLVVEVDDLFGVGDAHFYQQMDTLRQRFDFGKFALLEEEAEGAGFNGRRIKQIGGEFKIDMKKFVSERLQPVKLQTGRASCPREQATEEEKEAVRAAVGSLTWCAKEGRPDAAAAASLIASSMSELKVQDIMDLNKAIGQVKEEEDLALRIQGIPMEELSRGVVTDASYANVCKGKSQGAFAVLALEKKVATQGKGRCNLLHWRSGKLHRIVNSTLAAETQSLSRGLAELAWTVTVFNEFTTEDFDMKQWEKRLRQHRLHALVSEEADQELRHNVSIVDAKSLYDHLSRETTGIASDKRTALEMQVIRQALAETKTQIKWVPHPSMIVDSLTKRHGNVAPLIQLLRSGVLEVWSAAVRKRCAQLKSRGIPGVMRNATEASLQRTFKPRSRPQEVSRSTSLPVLSSSR